MREKAIPGQQKDRQQLGIYVENIENITLPAFRAARVQVNAYSILFVIAGELELNTGDNSYSVPDGHGILLCRKEYIAVTAGGETGCQWIEVRFDGNSAGDMLDYLGMSAFMQFSFGASAVASALDSMMTCQAAGEYFRAGIQLQSLLVSIMEGGEQETRDSQMQEIYQYIMEHFQEPTDLSTLAAMYGTSVSYFTRRFRQKFGQTPIQFLNQVRIINARLLLETTGLKIREVAQACGFEKLEYFCYVFKKEEGCTPTQFRINRRHMR
jgi:two-component system response regulator YesN